MILTKNVIFTYFVSIQIAILIAENEELKAKKSSSGDMTSLERKELERQLSTAKEDLFAEQKRCRAKIESLQEVSKTFYQFGLNIYEPLLSFTNLMTLEKD